MFSIRNGAVTLALALSTCVFSAPVLAAPQSVDLSVDYFKLSTNHPDVQQGGSFVEVHGQVDSNLLGGLPVASLQARDGSQDPNKTFHDLDMNDAIQWWTPHAGIVTADGSDIVNSNHYDSGPDFFPAGESSDRNGFRAAHYHGTFSGAGNFSASLQGDDDAWMFLDGNLIIDNGGIKPIGFNDDGSGMFGGGSHTLDVFFADRQVVQSQLKFNFQYCPVPEMSSMLSMGGLLSGGALLAFRSRRRRA